VDEEHRAVGGRPPGILGLGLIWAPDEILRKAIGNALDSVARAIPAGCKGLRCARSAAGSSGRNGISGPRSSTSAGTDRQRRRGPVPEHRDPEESGVR